FQAEDGIRDLIVTGVQTCALPISRNGAGPGDVREGVRAAREAVLHAVGEMEQPVISLPDLATLLEGPERVTAAAVEDLIEFGARSEERRVGKEWWGGGAGVS